MKNDFFQKEGGKDGIYRMTKSETMSVQKIKIAMGQMTVTGGCPEINLAKSIKMIREAATLGCRIVVLPECLDLGWTHPSARERAEPIPGPRSDTLCRAARESSIYVAAGLTEQSNDKIFNAAVLVSPEGEILLVHRKINILDIARDLYTPGDRLLVAETNAGKIGLLICADNFPDSLVLGHSLCRMGAQIILSPSAWAVDADNCDDFQTCGRIWFQSYTQLAKLYDITIVGVSNVGWITQGPWKGKKCIGCSLAIGPGGAVLARGPYGEEAETLMVFETETREQKVKGTDMAKMLRDKGFNPSLIED